MYRYDLGIVIVNYNVRHFISQCLLSIYNSQLYGLRLEIWVVDNASVDGSCSMISTSFPEVNLIQNSVNIGFAVANNQAIQKLKSKYTLLLNPDTLLEEDTLNACYNFMEKHPYAGAVGVRMIDGKGRFLPESKRKIPTLWNSFCKLSYLSDIFPSSRIFSGYNLGYLPEQEINEIEVLCGAFMFVRSEVLEKTGLLDESFFMYGEDIDLSYRILKAGYKIFYFPETSIVHYKGESTKKQSFNYVRTFYGAMTIYVNKHYTKGSANIFTNIIHFFIAIRGLISILGRILNNISMPIIDMVLIFFILIFFKLYYATYVYSNPSYYEKSQIEYIIILSSITWIYFLWFWGHYDKKSTLLQTITGLFFGSTIILAIYALLPENLRASRALLLIGIGVTFAITLVTKYLWTWILYERQSKNIFHNIAIVAHMENAKKLCKVIKNNQQNIGDIHFISPDKNIDNSFYSNDLYQLNSVIPILQIKEIIYSSEDVSIKTIIHSMSNINHNVSFKIGGDESLSIIGSSDRNQQGQIYTLDSIYKLSHVQQLRFKRVTDIFISVLLFIIFPIIWLITGFRLALFSNIFNTFIGKKTWVGYSKKSSDFQFLPEILPAVIQYPFSEKFIQYSPELCRKKNIEYAKLYSPYLDFVIVFKNLYRLGTKF